jgi:hypothetical protein
MDLVYRQEPETFAEDAELAVFYHQLLRLSSHQISFTRPAREGEAKALLCLSCNRLSSVDPG